MARSDGAAAGAMWNRVLIAWALYDFANSSFAAIVQATVFPAYYANVVVGNAEGRGDFWWGLVVSVSMTVVALTAPLLGGIADHAGIRKPFLIVFTLVSATATALLAVVGPGMIVTGFVLAVLGLTTYEAAIVYYNAYLPVIAPADRLGRVSAAGFTVGYAGSLVAFLAAWPFAAARAFGGCFLVAAGQFLLCALPAFARLPTDERRSLGIADAIRRGVHQTAATLREILAHPERRQLRRFLAAYLVYEDGVNTVIAFSAVFAAKTLGFGFTEIIALFMVVQVAALVGSALWARPTDRRGPRPVLIITLVQWIAVTVLAYFVRTKMQFWLVAVLAGTGLGAVQAASRTLMATLIPARREAEFFGFYALVGKTGAVLGPLVFGVTSAALGGNQRAAIVAVGLFFVVGLAILSGLRAGGPTSINRP